MRDIILFFYVLILAFLTAFPAVSAQTSTLWQQGGLRRGDILDIKYTLDNKNLVLVCTGSINELPSGYRVIQYNIASKHLDTLLIIESYRRPLLSPDTKFLLCDNGQNDTMDVWSLLQGQCIARIPLRGDIQSVEGRVFTEDNTIVVVVTDNGQTVIKHFNALNGVMIDSFAITPTYRGIAAYAQITANGRAVQLFTSDITHTTNYTEFWDVQTREHTVWQRPEKISGLVFDDRYRAYSSWSDTITIVYDTYTHDTVAVVKKVLSNTVLLPDGYLAGYTTERNTDSPSLSFTYQMHLIHLQTGIQQSVLFSDCNLAAPNLRPTLYFSPDYTSFTAAWSTPEYCDDVNPSSPWSGFGIYHVENGSLIDAWPASGHIAQVRTLVVSPDGTYGASTGDDFQTLLWDIKAGISTGKLAGKGLLAFSPDSTALVRANTITSALEKISLAPFAVIQSTPLLAKDVKTLRFSPDGEHLLCAAPSGTAVYSWPSLQFEYILSSAPDNIADASFTEDGKNIVVVVFNNTHPDEYSVQIRSVLGGALLSQKTFSGSLEGQTVQISHNASLLVGYSSSRIIVRRLSNGEILRDIPTQTFKISAPTLTPDGKYIFLASRVLVNRDMSDIISYEHVFTALSLSNPAEDITFDNTVFDKGYPGLATVAPSGTAVLYSCQTSCNIGQIYYTDLVHRSSPLIVSDTPSLHSAPLYTGKSSSAKIRLAAATAVPGIVTGVALSNSSLSSRFQLWYSRHLPDTVRSTWYNDSNTPVITLTMTSLYAGEYSFSILVYTAGQNNQDTLHIPVTVSVRGPKISFDVEEIDFGAVAVGSRVERVFYLRNDNDTALLYLTSARVKDATYQIGLSIPESLPTFLSSKNDLPVTVSYVPTKADSLNAEIIVTSNDPLRPEIHIPVRGRGTSTVSVSDNQQDGTLQLAPNPVGSILTISFPEPVQVATVELFSAGGRCMAVQQVATGEQIVTLDTATLSTGIYYCRMTTASGTITKPVLILH